MRLVKYSGIGRRQEAGMAVIVMIVLLGIVLAYVASNARTLDALGRDLRLIERHQTNRWNRASTAAPGTVSMSPTNRIGASLGGEHE